MLHFSDAEYAARLSAVRAQMERRGLGGLLLFAPESQYWLTGYDTFGYCFFQCLVVTPERTALLTRSADLRQAQLTSTLQDIRVWKDGAGKDPTEDLWEMLQDLGLSGKRLGWEIDTHGLTALNGGLVAARLAGKAELVPADDLVGPLRLVKSEAELAHVRRAAETADSAWREAAPLIRHGAYEGDILAALEGRIYELGGGYSGNPPILGSGNHALLCRAQAGRRHLQAQDQLTVEWAGTSAQYHAAMMRTAIVGKPQDPHLRMHEAAVEALEACEAALQPGRPMGEVFAEHARVLDARGLSAHRLNACGYSLGARYAPSWMEREMFYENAPTLMAPGMVFFLHMILMDSDSGCAMTLGRTSVVTMTGAEPLSALPLALDIF
ncbi:M24 family metallopeptidase [Rhodovulum sp. DZ06]|uniref:M24 family metallopeptidase n=1 Tax=Rhodovulum sp. DZ06 TaxID=3425126 RepID=UPI003D3495D9